jgi:hypothetical protein
MEPFAADSSASSELTAPVADTVVPESRALVSIGMAEAARGSPVLLLVHSATTTASVSTSARVLRREVGIRVTRMLTLRVASRRDEKWALA